MIYTGSTLIKTGLEFKQVNKKKQTNSKSFKILSNLLNLIDLMCSFYRWDVLELCLLNDK